MRDYLNFYSEKFNKLDFNKWHIDDLLWFINTDKFSDDSLEILKKYCNCINKYKEIKISDNEAEILFGLYDESDNIIVKALLDFLLSTNKLYYKNSKLVKDCLEFIHLYFSNISNKDGGLSSHNLEVIMRWTLYKFPQSKVKISELLFSSIIDNKVSDINYFAVSDYFIRDSDLVNVFSKEQYLDILEKFYNDNPSEKEIYFYSDVYKDFIKYLKSKDNVVYKKWLKKYCDFILNNIKKFDYHFKQIELQIVRNKMDFLKCYSDEEYLLLDKELDDANHEQLSKMQEYTIDIPKEQQKMLDDKILETTNNFKALNNADKIALLLVLAHPLSLIELKKHYEDSKKGLSGLVTNNIIDSDGRVINFEKLKDYEDFSLKSGSTIKIMLGLNFDVLINPFFNTYVSDEESEKYINEIFNNNFLVDKERAFYLSNLYIKFFKMEFINSSYDIVQELEESLRYYFKNKGLNILKKNGTRDYIGLSQIFNDDETNNYRECLLEIIDEDFYFTLKWFLVDNYGFGLRNKTSHRFNSNRLYEHSYSIYIIIHILRLYWGFQKC